MRSDMEKEMPMKPSEVCAAVTEFAAEIGIRADVSVTASSGDANAYIAVYPQGICKPMAFILRGDKGADWADIIAAARTKWATYQQQFESEQIEALALEIIRLTAQFGKCTDAALRGEKFSDADLKGFGESAVAKANEMAANGPFKIIKAATANAA